MSVESKLSRLSLDLQNVGHASKPTKTTSSTKSPDPLLADSWEDDVSETDSTEADTRSPSSEHSVPMEAPGPTHLKSPTTRAIEAEKELSSSMNLDDLPNPPPPTPISPSIGYAKSDWPANRILAGAIGGRPIPLPTTSSISPARSTPPSSDQERKRPEKTTATANRLIAGALGIKAPPKTEEQKRYDRAVREAEMKKRNKEKENKQRAEEEERRAKDAVWDA